MSRRETTNDQGPTTNVESRNEKARRARGAGRAVQARPLVWRPISDRAYN